MITHQEAMTGLASMIAEADDRTCLLCGGPQAGIGVFVPNCPEMWGARSGSRRYIGYILCERHCRTIDDPEQIEMVEAILWAKFRETPTAGDDHHE